METAVTPRQKASRRFVLLTSLASLVGALVLLLFSWTARLENPVYDLCFRLSHKFTARADSAPELGLVAIDDRTVNPDYSPYSSPYGKDGWLTRDLWDLNVKQMGQLYLPKVLAYDILFASVSSKEAKDQKNVQVIRDVESSGNKEFQNTLIDFDDARSQGLPAPRALFAFYFPDDVEGSTQLTEEENVNQARWFKKLDRFRLPPGCVAAGGNPPVFHSVWLPMDEILSAPSYFLGPISIKADDDGVHRRAPMLYAYQAPGSAQIDYVPGFALEAFLLWLDIEPQDLKSPGAGLPCVTAQPGGDLKITTANGEWTVPVDTKFQMTLVPSFKFKSAHFSAAAPTPSPGSPLKIDTEMFRPAFVDLLDDGMRMKREENPFVPLTQGRILMVGVAYTGGGDLGDFPLERGAPNALIHLQALNNIMRGIHLTTMSYFEKVLICVAMAILMAWIYLWAPTRLPGLWSLTLIVSYPVLVAGALISRNFELPLVAPSFVGLFCFGLNSFHIYQLTRRGREEMRRLFSSVTSPRVLRLLEENPAAFNVHRKTAVTILFSDVAGFTTLSEKLDPGQLAALMNRYLSPMTEILIRHDGYLVQYAGDGIMVVWGMPLPDAEHEYKACVAAWEHIQAAEAMIETLPDGRAYRFGVRIGVNTGIVSAGNMGSAQKQQYTVIGDDVNLAARLEPTNKDYGTKIILGALTYAAVKGHIKARALDKIVVKGKTEPALIYELLGVENSPEPGPWVAAYEQGLECLWRRQWDEADQLLVEAIQLRGGDAASELQRARIQHYRENPPPENWQGEYVRKAKD